MSRAPTVSRRDLLVLGGLLGAAGLGAALMRRAQPVGTVLEQTPVVRQAMSATGPEAGNAGGDITLILFTDYNCGACRVAHPAMMAAVEQDGGVKLRFLDWPIFGDDSRAAARIALAAEPQGLYPRLHAALMQGGRADARSAEAALAELGGDVAAMQAVLSREGPRIDGQLSRNAVHAFGLGLGGTPGHLIGRVLVRGAVPERDFRRAIDRARALR